MTTTQNTRPGDDGDLQIEALNQANPSGTFEQCSRTGKLLMAQSITKLVSRGVPGAECLPLAHPSTGRPAAPAAGTAQARTTE